MFAFSQIHSIQCDPSQLKALQELAIRKAYSKAWQEKSEASYEEGWQAIENFKRTQRCIRCVSR